MQKTVQPPVTARPVTARPVTARPVTARPVTARPVTARPVTARPVASRAATRWIRSLTAFILLLLATQFLVGIVVNLFVTIPDAHPGAQASEYFSGVAQGVSWAIIGGALPLQAHVLIGLLLLVTVSWARRPRPSGLGMNGPSPAGEQ